MSFWPFPRIRHIKRPQSRSSGRLRAHGKGADEFLAAASIPAAALILSTWTSSRPASTRTSQTSPGSALHRGQAKVMGLMATYSGGFIMTFAMSHSEWTGRPSSFVPASLTATSLPPTKHVKIGVGMGSEYWHLHYIIVGISETVKAYCISNQRGPRG